jgi:hypothetical protein
LTGLAASTVDAATIGTAFIASDALPFVQLLLDSLHKIANWQRRKLG